MLNVDKAMAMLERLDDASLQRYAQMHKQDPYMLSLALSESNRRKRMRASADMQTAQGAEPPPVADQAIMSMAPEDTGIAQLPVADMNFSDGGIIAFSGAGAVPELRYDPSAITGMMTPWSEIERRIRAGDPNAIEYTRTYMQNRVGGGAVPDSVRQLIESIPPPTPTAAEVRRVESYGPETTSAPAFTPAPTPVPRPAPRPAPSAGITALPRADGIESTIKRLQTAQAAMGSASDPFAEQRERARTEGLAELEQAQAESEALRPKGRPMEGLRTRLEKEEGEVESKREENLKMALINAGLGMMAGTSRYAMVNIGAGGAQGLKTYREGLKDLEKAAERRQELFARIEQLERAEQEGRADRVLKLKSEKAALGRQYRESAIRGLENTLDLNRKDATAAFTANEQAMRDEARIQSAERIAAGQQAAATARAEFSEKRADRRQEIAARQAELRSAGTRLNELQRQIRELPMGGYNPEQKKLYAELLQERDATIGEMRKAEAALRRIAGEESGSPPLDLSGFRVRGSRPSAP